MTDTAVHRWARAGWLALSGASGGIAGVMGVNWWQWIVIVVPALLGLELRHWDKDGRKENRHD